MNKRDFLVSGAGAALATATLAAEACPVADATAHAAAAKPAGPSLLGRTQRHPDLSAPSADRYEAYVGESFAVNGTTLRLARVTRRADARTEQFSVRFEAADGALPASGTHVLEHVATGQRVALHLEAGAAHFALLA